MDLTSFAEDVGAHGPITIAGLATRGGAVPSVRCVRAPSGIEWIQADEMTVGCGAGTPVDELAAALREVGQRTVLPVGGSAGGALSAGRSGSRQLGDGPLRDSLLQARYVGADGAVVKAGGPTVKNVSGFDVCRLLVGARGTLGLLGDVILRTRPIPLCAQWYRRPMLHPLVVLEAQAVLDGLYRPTTVLWDGHAVWVLLEGHPDDVREQAACLDLVECEGPPALPPNRSLVAPSTSFDPSVAGDFVMEVGVGVVHTDVALPPLPADPALARLTARVKHQFDPSQRLNPGVVVG